MMVWRLLFAQTRGIRLRLVVATLATGILDAVFVFCLAGLLSGIADWSLVTSALDILAIITVVQLGQAWIARQLASQLAGLTRRIRQGLLSAYLKLEPAALPHLPLEELKAGLTVLPAQLFRLHAEATLGLSSLVGDLACMAATVMLAPTTGAVLLFAVKGQAVLLLAQVPRLRSATQAAKGAEAALDTALGHLLSGVKQMLLDPRHHGEALDAAFTSALQARHAARATYRGRLATREALSGAVRLLSAAAVTFVTLLAGSPPGQAAALFVVALLVPLDWMRAIPLITAASAASDRLAALETQLQDAISRVPSPPSAHPVANFASLELRDAGFAYPARPGTPGAMIGPLSCRIEPGRVLFIAGGRGSGKSTLLHLICGIMTPTTGSILINGRSVEGRTSRGLVAFVPAQVGALPHIFDTATSDDMRTMLDAYGLTDVAHAENGRIRSSGLSAAQSKRLALIFAIAQRRPILALDEWAADQERGERERFYLETIPQLRAQGVAIVLTTRDTRYFGVADDVITMRDGLRATSLVSLA